MSFSIPVSMQQASGPNPTRAFAIEQFPLGNGEPGAPDIVWLTKDLVNTAPGVYHFDGYQWRSCFPQAAVDDFVVNGGVLTIYPPGTTVPQPLPSDARIYRNGVLVISPTVFDTTATWAVYDSGGPGPAAGVNTFNTRTGDVVLTLQDVTGAGGAPLDSPHFTGQPTAPTPPVGDDSQALATTAYVIQARQQIIPLTASGNGQTSYTLPFTPLDAARSDLEFNGVVYRFAGGDYTVASATLTLVNPAIAPHTGDSFLFVTA